MNSALSEIIKKLRREFNLTQKQLAANTGLSLSSIISYENGLREPNSKAMATLESYFDVTGAYLRGENDERAPIDSEILETMIKGTPNVLNAIFDASQKCSDLDQKQINGILIELRHVLQPDTKNPAQKSASIDLLKEAIWTTNGFIDMCLLADHTNIDFENQVLKARKAIAKQYADLLLGHQDSLLNQP